MNEPADAALDAFIARWDAAGGSERANYQLFVNELCELLGVPTPDPARDDTRDNAYVFERRVTFQHGDGSEDLLGERIEARLPGRPSAAPRVTPGIPRRAIPAISQERSTPNLFLDHG